MLRISRRLVYIFFILSSCSAESEDPGLCNISCSGSIIGPVEAEIELMGQSSGVTCQASEAGTALSSPLTFFFRVVEKVDFEGVEQLLPKPSVSIDPIVNGLMSSEAIHNPNVVLDQASNAYSPARYQGIITPQSNWCSDSCGVVTMEVYPICPPAGETSTVDVQIHTGSLFSESASVVVQTQDNQ